MENTVILTAGSGYHEEYMGNIAGKFCRTQADMPVTVLVRNARGNADDVLIRLPNGKRGLTIRQNLAFPPS